MRDDIRAHTSGPSNERIDRTTRAAIDDAQRSAELTRARFAELDREWTVDRALMLNFAIIGGVVATLALRSARRSGSSGGWGALLYTQLGFLAYHAVRRWCPPLPVFRRLGFRSDREICVERTALAQAARSVQLEAP
jgi:hypothetical protein